VAIMVTAPPQGQLPAESGTALSAPANKPFVSPKTIAVTPATQAVSYSPSEQVNINRLNAYLLRHNQMARTAGRQGFVSFVPIVATPIDAEEQAESTKVLTDLESAENK